MKTVIASLLLLSAVLSGCVVEPLHRSGYRDRDRDGVANRYDRDRDGDGVRNSRDRAPNNPYRY